MPEVKPPATLADLAAKARQEALRLAVGGSTAQPAPTASTRKRRRLAVVLGGVLAGLLAGYLGLPADTLAPVLAAVLDVLCDSITGICGE